MATIRGAAGRVTTLSLSLETASKIRQLAGDRPLYKVVDEMVDEALAKHGPGPGIEGRSFWQRTKDKFLTAPPPGARMAVHIAPALHKLFGDDSVTWEQVLTMSDAEREQAREQLTEWRTEIADLARKLDAAKSQGAFVFKEKLQ